MNILSEQADLNQNAYNELVKAVEDIRKNYKSSQSDNFPSIKWVAGKFQQLAYINSIEQSLKSNQDLPDDKKEEYEKIVALKDIGLKYGFIKKVGSNYTKTEKGSKFVQSLAKSFTDWRDMASELKSISGKEDDEWLASLSDTEKEYVEIYKQLTAKQYAYLIGLVEKQQDKKNYTDRVAVSDSDDSRIVSHLQNLNLINNNYTLNSKLIKNMLDFLNDKSYARLKPLNNDITYIAKRISADRALLKNYLDRNLDKSSFRRSPVAREADVMLDSLNSVEKMLVKKAYDNIRSLTPTETEHLKKLNIIDSDNTFTSLGKFIAIVLTKDDNLDTLQKRGEKPTQYSRLNKSDVGPDSNRSTRMADKARTRNQSFKNFLSSK